MYLFKVLFLLLTPVIIRGRFTWYSECNVVHNRTFYLRKPTDFNKVFDLSRYTSKCHASEGDTCFIKTSTEYSDHECAMFEIHVETGCMKQEQCKMSGGGLNQCNDKIANVHCCCNGEFGCKYAGEQFIIKYSNLIRRSVSPGRVECPPEPPLVTETVKLSTGYDFNRQIHLKQNEPYRSNQAGSCYLKACCMLVMMTAILGLKISNVHIG